MSETLQEEIDNIMDTFDFGRVKQIMDDSDWKWGDGNGGMCVPCETELRQSARRLLNGLRESSITATGGFTAILDDNGPMLFWGINGMGGE